MTDEQLDRKGQEFNMIIMLDSMAERYGLLPSELMRRADTFDLAVLTTAISYRNDLQEQAENPRHVPRHKQPTAEQMKAMIERARKKENI